MTDHDQLGYRALNRAECLDLLTGVHIGAIGVTVGALPYVYPIAVTRLDDDLVARLAPTGVLARSIPGRIVALLVTGPVAGELATSWSVTMTGHAEPIVERSALEVCRALPIRRWSEDDIFVRVPSTLVSGLELYGHDRS